MEQNIVVIGGDSRYFEIIRKLKMLPHLTVFLIGYDKLQQGFTGLKQIELQDIQPEKIDVIILPITGTDENGYVEAMFSSQKIQLAKEWFQQLKKGTKIFTGIMNSYLSEIAESAQFELIPLLDRDDVAIYNSIPTAEGTILLAMEHTDYTIHGASVIISGFGRVGQTLASKFSALGANVHVSAKSLHDLARITAMGLNAIPIEQISNRVEACDILINTIPARVIDESVIEKLPAHTVIIDLASKPGGTDFLFANKRGIKAILAKSLPNVVAPKTAGKILADVISQFLEKRDSE